MKGCDSGSGLSDRMITEQAIRAARDEGMRGGVHEEEKDGVLPNCFDCDKGPSRVATAIYASKGPAGALIGFAATVFKFVSKEGTIALAKETAAVESSFPRAKSALPTKEQKARRTTGLELVISFAITPAESPGNAVSD